MIVVILMDTNWKYCFTGVLICVAIATIFLEYSSAYPDGLDKTAIALGFNDKKQETYGAPMNDYSVNGDGTVNGRVIALFSGAVLAGGIGMGIGKIIKSKG